MIIFFALIALITIIRIILKREDTAWKGMRVGFFIERHGRTTTDDGEDDDG